MIKFAKNVVLFNEGDTNGSLYRIKSGQCRVEKNLPNADGVVERKVLAVMGPERMFGEMSVMSRDAKTSASIVADQNDTEVYVIDVAFVYDLFQTEPGLRQRFFYNIWFVNDAFSAVLCFASFLNLVFDMCAREVSNWSA